MGIKAVRLIVGALVATAMTALALAECYVRRNPGPPSA